MKILPVALLCHQRRIQASTEFSKIFTKPIRDARQQVRPRELREQFYNIRNIRAHDLVFAGLFPIGRYCLVEKDNRVVTVNPRMYIKFDHFGSYHDPPFI